MEIICKEYNDIHLLLVGPDELDGAYQKLVKNKKLTKYVHFLGRREDIPEILSITNIVVSASLREGLPVNIIESFSAGKPVIALECRGMKDLIINNKNGFICNNQQEFIKSIIRIYQQRQFDVNEQRKVNDIILNKVSIENVTQEIKTIYKL